EHQPVTCLQRRWRQRGAIDEGRARIPVGCRLEVVHYESLPCLFTVTIDDTHRLVVTATIIGGRSWIEAFIEPAAAAAAPQRGQLGRQVRLLARGKRGMGRDVLIVGVDRQVLRPAGQALVPTWCRSWKKTCIRP